MSQIWNNKKWRRGRTWWLGLVPLGLLSFSVTTLVPKRKPACALKIACYCESTSSFNWNWFTYWPVIWPLHRQQSPLCSERSRKTIGVGMGSGYRELRLIKRTKLKKKLNQTCPLSYIQTGFPLIVCETSTSTLIHWKPSAAAYLWRVIVPVNNPQTSLSYCTMIKGPVTAALKMSKLHWCHKLLHNRGTVF